MVMIITMSLFNEGLEYLQIKKRGYLELFSIRTSIQQLKKRMVKSSLGEEEVERRTALDCLKTQSQILAIYGHVLLSAAVMHTSFRKHQ